MRKTAVVLLFLSVASLFAAAADTLTANEAKNHVGENATVCGKVASVHFAAGSKGTPTFINLDKPYPDHIFTILIWGDDMPNFKENPTHWDRRKACVTGKITLYSGVPEIVAKKPDQITLDK